jgi:hypothetical protein
MREAEKRYLAALPERIAIWRGCYDHNREGFSWTDDRTVAERFPTLERYKHDGKKPILLRGVVNRKDILFVKHDREECEIVPRPGRVYEIRETEIAPEGTKTTLVQRPGGTGEP